MRRLFSLVGVAALAGCYVYRPLDTVEPRVGARVSADLTDVGSDTLSRYVGPGVTSLRGGVVSAEQAAVTLAVTSVMDRSGQEQFWKGERVRVPRAVVRDFEQRRLSVGAAYCSAPRCWAARSWRGRRLREASTEAG